MYFARTGTPPGQGPTFRDCPGHSGTVGNYELCMHNTSVETTDGIGDSCALQREVWLLTFMLTMCATTFQRASNSMQWQMLGEIDVLWHAFTVVVCFIRILLLHL